MVGYFGVYGSLAPSEVFLPRYGPLRSVFASLLWTGEGFVLIGVDCVVVGVSMITL